ncbi:MAG: hypothetical protein QOG70_3167 [Solirubrobacteraceae bacterium]|jgi:hypothetical protein|nr:hypothetical protein [Solirubrobacteraceae bacterium]
MREPLRVLVVVLAIVLTAGIVHARASQGTARPAGAYQVDGAAYRLDAAQARRTGTIHLSDDLRRAGFRFGPDVSADDQAAILRAVADARPEAQRLIGLIDGLVDMHVGQADANALGVTQTTGTRYTVTIDLGRVAQMYGQRGIDRVVLHELGHVLDFALLPTELTTPLDAGIPQGWGCDDGETGACAPRTERFAESFAKWATGDIGVDLYIGYKIPPPPSLEAWGVPLARLRT